MFSLISIDGKTLEPIIVIALSAVAFAWLWNHLAARREPAPAAAVSTSSLPGAGQTGRMVAARLVTQMAPVGSSSMAGATAPGSI
jgi:hypothetical protein